jgi:tetratricopeptide (TPR) repeat protein
MLSQPVLSFLFSFTSASTIAHVAATCRTFRDASTSPDVWKALYHRDYPQDLAESLSKGRHLGQGTDWQIMYIGKHSPKAVHNDYLLLGRYYYNWLQGGLDLVWNTRFAEAEAYFKGMENGGPHLWAILGPGEVAFWKAVFTDNQQCCEQAMVLLDKAWAQANVECSNYKQKYVKKAVGSLSNLLAHTPLSSGAGKPIYDRPTVIQMVKELESMVAMFGICLGKSLLHFKNQSYVKGPYYFRKAWKWVDRAKDLVAEMEKAGLKKYVPSELQGNIHFGLGFFHFVVSLVPPKFKWFLDLIGFRANRRDSFDELLSSWKSGSSRATNAGLMMMWLYFLIFDDKKRAFEILDYCNAAYPTSALTQLTTAYVYQMSGTLDQAILWYKKTYDSAAEVKLSRLVAKYFTGTCHWLLCDWDGVIKNTEEYLAETESIYFQCFGHFRLAFSYWITGQDKSKVDAMLAKVLTTAKQSYDQDEYATRLVHKYNKYGTFTPFDATLVPAQCYLEGLQFSKVLEMAETIPKMLYNDDSSVKYTGFENVVDCMLWHYFLKATALKGLHKEQEAEDLFRKNILPVQNKIKNNSPEYMILPYTLIELGEIMLDKKQPQEAQKLFEEAKKHSGYEGEKYAFYRISKNIEKIATDKLGIQL